MGARVETRHVLRAAVTFATAAETVNHFRRKVRFYRKLMVLGGLWIFWLPLLFLVQGVFRDIEKRKFLYAAENIRCWLELRT